uniref:SEC7 domain-containing protein n=1 Tax=Macrostomum lignano TaxID=282301 RepID=A0A1I8FR12_9PLAT
ALIARYWIWLGQPGAKASDALRRCYDDEENNERIISRATVQEAFSLAKLTFREYKSGPRVRTQLLLSHTGPASLDEAVQDFINCHHQRRICRAMTEVTAARTIPSRCLRRCVATYTWPALVQGSEVVARGEACTRRGAATSKHGVLLEISDQDLARLPGGWSPQSERRRTQHVYESYNSEERDNDEDTACYHDAQSRLRPSRQQLLNSSRPTGASAAGHHEAADVDPCGELLSIRRRRTSSSSRMNRDEHSLQHHHYRSKRATEHKCRTEAQLCQVKLSQRLHPSENFRVQAHLQLGPTADGGLDKG